MSNEDPNKKLKSDLIEAVNASDLDKIKKILRAKEDELKDCSSNIEGEIEKCVNEAKDGRHNTLLMVAVKHGDLDIAKFLLENGAKVDEGSTRIARTPLMEAAGRGNLDMVKLLVGHGANLDAKDKNKESTQPLKEAVRKGKFAVVKFLVENDADIYMGKNVGEDGRERPLIGNAIVCHYPSISKFLIATYNKKEEGEKKQPHSPKSST